MTTAADNAADHTTDPAVAHVADNVPYADPEPLDELIEECRCAQAECEAHRVDAGVRQQAVPAAHPEPVSIDETTRHLVDGLSDYGS